MVTPRGLFISFIFKDLDKRLLLLLPASCRASDNPFQVKNNARSPVLPNTKPRNRFPLQNTENSDC